MRSHKAGFTLVELLVVMAIVALLVSILIPTLSKAREQGVLVKCRATIRDMGLKALMYSGDYKFTMPPNFADNSKGQALFPYGTKSLSATGCPGKGKGTHEGPAGWSYTALQAYSFPIATWPEWGPIRVEKILRPTQTALGIENADFNTYSPIYWETDTQDQGRHHSQGMNVVFPDNHSEWLKSNVAYEASGDYTKAEWRTRFPAHYIPQTQLSPFCTLKGCFWHPI